MKFRFEKLHVYFLALLAMILPNIVYLNAIPQPKDSIYYIAFPKSEINFDFFSYGKMMFLVFMTIASLFFYLWNSYKKIKWQPVYGFLLAYAFFIVLSTVLSPFRELALRGLGDRYEGTFTLLCYLLLFFMAYDVAKDKDDRKIVLGGIILGSVIVGLVGIFQYWGFDIYRQRWMQQIITPKEYNDFNFKFTFGKYTIYSSLYNTNFVGSYMALMMFLGIGLYFNAQGKKDKNLAFIYTLLMYSNWIGCRSRAGFLGSLPIFIFALLLFHKLIKFYKKELISILIAFSLIFIIMNTKGTDEGNLASKFTTIETPSAVNTYLRDAYVENGALVIIDKFTNIKVFQKDGKVQFFNEENALLLPKVIKRNITLTDENGNEVQREMTTISFEDEKYKRYSFNLLAPGIIELEYNHENIRTIKYPIYFVENKYKSSGITGKLFDIEKIPRWKALDGYETLGSFRIYNWTRTLPILKDTMFFGYGPDTFSIIFPQNDTFGKTISYGMANIILDKPHNMYLQIGVNTGVISMILFIVGLFIFFLDGIVRYRNLTKLPVEAFLWLGVLAYHATGMFNDSLVSVAPVAWLYFGLSTGYIYNNVIDEKTV